MIESPVTKKTILIALICSSFICLLIFLTRYFDKHTKIVFCNVGQGDGIYIRVKNKVDLLIDAGRDKKIISCLGKYMPFWDRKIEIAILTHPDYDHYGGFTYLVDRYEIGKFIVNNFSNKSLTFKKLKTKLINKKIRTEFHYAGDQIKILDDTLTFYWPTPDFDSLKDNDFSFVSIFQENNFRALFTGDASPVVLNRLSAKSLQHVDILQVSHHGSKNGLTKRFLDLADPEVSVISVGENNSYDHPHGSILDMLEAKNIKIRRTDEEGDIVFKIQSSKSK